MSFIKILSLATLLSFTSISYSEENAETPELADSQETTTLNLDCRQPTAPIIPDGNTASQDELISAQKSLKSFQKELVVFRNCLAEFDQSLVKDKETMAEDAYLKAKEEAVKMYNQSVEFEQKAADDFNASVRAYKVRQPQTEK